MAYWLLKTEPSSYSAADLAREKRTTWDGVKNALALKHLRAIAAGDGVLIYHTGDERRCVATAIVTRAAPTDGAIELAFESMLARPVPLAEINGDPAFAGWDLLRLSRLSVVPTSTEIWNRVRTLSSSAPAK